MNTLIRMSGKLLIVFPLLGLLSFGEAPNSMKTRSSMEALKTNRDTIAGEMRHELDEEFRLWYPLSIDTVDGGFFSDINYKWELDGIQNKFIVSQARHVWAAAHASLFYPKHDALRKVALHGLEFLRNKMLDRTYGGFYDLVTKQGDPIEADGKIVKRAYGNAFVIYGLAAYYRAFGDTAALHLAQETFQWLEKHSYDLQHGGYFQFISREGIPLTDGYRGVPPKDQNSTIHLLEAFTELYRVWPDPIVKERLLMLLRLVRDTITTDRGYMVLFFKSDWTPVSFQNASAGVRERNYEFDHVSFGHDVETAYLMLEASEVLGIKNDTVTLIVAKKMVDHTLKYGWDKERGGIYDGGYYASGESQPSIVRNTKEWWCQVEALNSFLLMSELFPRDEHNYFDKFCVQWEYCEKYLIDHEYGGWYWGGIDIVPRNKYVPKVSIWKCNYHTSRSLINCINRLKSETRK
ncbi:MAG: AGE family epimerase/isomerase [Bacteroidota bacterium]|jgi:mannobiose 2-epimerase